MSSRLRLQKKSAAKKEAELQATLQVQEDVEKAQFDSLQGAAPGTAVVIAGQPPGEPMDEGDAPEDISAEAAHNTAPRKQKQTAKMLISDSESDGAEDKSAEEASDFSAESEPEQSESSASSEEQSNDESPPPAKRGKKVAVSIQRGSKANDQKQAKFAKGSGQTTKQVAAVVKPMSGRKAATALPSAAQQKAVRTASPLAESDAKETLPVKARVIKGNASLKLAQPATSMHKAVSDQDTPADCCQPSISAAAAPSGPSTTSKGRALDKGHGTMTGATVLPRHMTKGIQINSPGPAYRAPGLKRPQGGKPLHQIQPRNS